MDVVREVALMSDPQVERSLNIVLKGLAVRNRAFGRLFATVGDMETALTIISKECGTQWVASEINEPQEVEQRSRLLRSLVLVALDDPELSQMIMNAINNSRATLLEPVSTALTLAAIVFVLSTHISVEYAEHDGHRDLKVKVEKKPTSAAILNKIANFM